MYVYRALLNQISLLKLEFKIVRKINREYFVVYFEFMTSE